jgi:brefeldin A-resistance guanine nucleotide exchange factor 1
MRDAETVEALGKDLANALQSVIRNASNYHDVVISRVTYYLLSLLRASDEHDFIRVPVIIHSFSSFNQGLLHRSAVPLLQGIIDCMKYGTPSLRSEMSASPDFWAILLALHSVPEVSAYVFRVLEYISAPPHAGITVDNYEPALKLLDGFASLGSVGASDEQRRDVASVRGNRSGPSSSRDKQAGPVKAPRPKHRSEVERGTRALAIVFGLTSRVPAFITASQLSMAAAWNTYWTPLFRVLARQCLNPCRELRHAALAHLLRALLSKDLASEEHKEWTAIFSDVLFPLLTQLLKPEVYASDPVGMGETRVQAATGLCKVFLHYLVVLVDWEGMVELWVRVLGMMERLMNSGVGDNLVSSLPQPSNSEISSIASCLCLSYMTICHFALQ